MGCGFGVGGVGEDKTETAMSAELVERLREAADRLRVQPGDLAGLPGPSGDRKSFLITLTQWVAVRDRMLEPGKDALAGDAVADMLADAADEIDTYRALLAEARAR